MLVVVVQVMPLSSVPDSLSGRGRPEKDGREQRLAEKLAKMEKMKSEMEGGDDVAEPEVEAEGGGAALPGAAQP